MRPQTDSLVHGAAPNGVENPLEVVHRTGGSVGDEKSPQHQHSQESRSTTNRPSAALMISGGSRRTTRSAVTLMISPASSAAFTSAPQAIASSIPSISPRPRISTNSGRPSSSVARPSRTASRPWVIGKIALSRDADRDVARAIAANFGSVDPGAIRRRLKTIGGLGERPEKEVNLPCLYIQAGGDKLVPVAYPEAGPQDYDSLARYVEERLIGDQEYLVLGESFAGPLAYALATRPGTVEPAVL